VERAIARSLGLFDRTERCIIPAGHMEDIYCFAGNPLDRVSERRDDREWIAALLDAPGTRMLALRDLKPLIRGTAIPALDWQPLAPWRGQIETGATLIFLGIADGCARFAIDATGVDIAPDLDTEPIDVRALAPTIPVGEAAILAEARSLIDWHARHRFCAQCGSPTRVASAGWVRRCPDCRASHFPRTDPVVIMLAVRGDRAARPQPSAPGALMPRRLSSRADPGKAVPRGPTSRHPLRPVRYLACSPGRSRRA
jgi:NAD+ diphosphatase